MPATDITDAISGWLIDAPPMEDGLTDNIAAELAKSGVRRVSDQDQDPTAYRTLLSTAVEAVVLDQLAHVERFELEPRASDNHGLHFHGHYLRAHLTATRTLVGVIWEDFGRLGESPTGVSWWSDVFLVDETGATFTDGRPAVALAMTARALAELRVPQRAVSA